jgi:hypothetical protein
VTPSPGLIVRLGTLAVLCALSGPALAAESIVLMPLDLSGGLEASRADLEAAVTKGLAVAGRPVIPPDETGARGTYVVSGAVGREGSTFTASFKLVRTSDKQTLNTQENHCDLADCSVAELARRSARELVRQTLGRPLDVPPAPPEPPPAKAPPDSASSRPAWLGAGAIAAGAVAIGVGVYLININHRCTGSTMPMHSCKYQNTTLAGGIASVAGGAAAAALGVYLLVHDDGKASVAVGVRPSGVVVAGRF